MSGDVQPRKRKDKRRKKDGDPLGISNDTASFHKIKSTGKKSFDLGDQGERIHVQNEHGVGGNICVKIVFFCLFGLLIGTVGIIYMQSQGSTDVELPTIEQSRFAEYFAGWLDESTDDHDHETSGGSEQEDDHGDEEDEHHESEQEDDGAHENEDQTLEQDLFSSLFNFGGKEENDERGENGNDSGDDEPVTQSNRVEDESEEAQNEEEEDDNDGGDDDDDNENVLRTQLRKKFIKFKFDSEEIEDDLEEEGSDDDADDEEEDKYDASQMDEEEEEPIKKVVKKKFSWSFKKIQKLPILEDNEKEEDDGDDDDEEEEDKESEQLSDEDVIDQVQKKMNEDKNQGGTKNQGQEPDTIEDDTINTGSGESVKDVKNQMTNDDSGYDEIDESDEADFGHSEQKVKVEKEEANKAMPAAKAKEFFQEQKDTKSVTTSEKKAEEIERDEKGEETDVEPDPEAGRVVVKLGVGIALIIVAHLVLIQKWQARGNVPPDETPSNEANENDNVTSEPEPVIFRRQTLVPENISLNEEFGDEEECSEDEGDEYSEKDGEEEEDDYVEGDEELGEEEEEEDDEFLGKEKLEMDEKHFGEKGHKLENAKFNDKKELSEKNEEDDYDEGENEEDEYGEELVEEEEEYDENPEEEEYDDDDYEEGESDEPGCILSKNLNASEDNTPVPPPRVHKRGGLAAEEEVDFQSGEVFEQEVYQAETQAEEEREDIPQSVAEHEPEHEPEPTSTENKVGNEEDWFRQEFLYADENFENNPKAALRVYEEILSKRPAILKALIGRARVLDHIAERERSNAYLKQASNAYRSLLLQDGHRLDDDMFEKLGERCISRMRFGGHLAAAIDIHKALVARFPNNPKFRNTLAVTYLMLNQIEPARKVLTETLTRWPRNGFALVHYGFIVKTTDNNMEEGARLLMEGIRTKEDGVIEGMFFFHLGDALNRLGKPEEALKWYDLGVKEGLFKSRYQRSLYNVNRLRSQPWWTKEQTTYQEFFKKLEQNWREIRREGLELLNSKGLFKEETENLKDTGDWRQLDLFFRGRKQTNCQKAPVTCSLVSSFKPAARCTRGQIKFSVMLPGTHVWPHCGPTNCRLRSHLGLVVPPKTYLRVADETRTWEEGKFIIFDDSFEHEVWHNGTGFRLVLIVDIWHPELTEQERTSLSPI